VIDLSSDDEKNNDYNNDTRKRHREDPAEIPICDENQPKSVVQLIDIIKSTKPTDSIKKLLNKVIIRMSCDAGDEIYRTIMKDGSETEQLGEEVNMRFDEMACKKKRRGLKVFFKEDYCWFARLYYSKLEKFEVETQSITIKDIKECAKQEMGEGFIVYEMAFDLFTDEVDKMIEAETEDEIEKEDAE
jgi:hypothetical protein